MRNCVHVHNIFYNLNMKYMVYDLFIFIFIFLKYPLFGNACLFVPISGVLSADAALSNLISLELIFLQGQDASYL